MRVFAFLFYLVSSFAAAQQICGMGDLSAQPPDKIRELLNLYSPYGPTAGEQCGTPGEDFGICRSCWKKRITAEMMASVGPMLAHRRHRQWHSDWHFYRGIAANVKSSRDRNRVRAALRRYGIEDPDEFIRLHNEKDGEVAGEDFLFMHRKMIKMVNLRLAYDGQPCIGAWRDLPQTVDDAEFPHYLFKAEHSEADRQEARLLFARYKDLVQKLREPFFLRDISLNDLGLLLQNDLHTYMHFIYNYRGGACNGEEIGDRLECDDLGPTESSPVNPMFWKLHSLTDQFIEHWLFHNGRREIAENCEGRPNCYEWKGTWVGRVPEL